MIVLAQYKALLSNMVEEPAKLLSSKIYQIHCIHAPNLDTVKAHQCIETGDLGRNYRQHYHPAGASESVAITSLEIYGRDYRLASKLQESLISNLRSKELELDKVDNNSYVKL